MQPAFAWPPPSLLMMTPSVAYTSAVILVVFGLYRFYQGASVIKYQRNLRRLPRFAMSSDQIPCFKNHLYLGQGFRWTQTHTQRLKDTMAPISAKYIRPSRINNFARELERKLEGSKLQWVADLTSKDHPLNPVRPYPAVGGNPVTHAVELEEKQVLLAMSERVGHTLCLGTTRVGKSRLAEILIEQDIRRNDGPVILLDPKSDAGLLTRMYMAAKRAGREDDFYMFHLGFRTLPPVTTQSEIFRGSLRSPVVSLASFQPRVTVPRLKSSHGASLTLSPGHW